MPSLRPLRRYGINGRFLIVTLCLFLALATFFNRHSKSIDPLIDDLRDVKAQDRERAKAGGKIAQDADLASAEQLSRNDFSTKDEVVLSGAKSHNAFVVASQKTENTTWLRQFFPEWEANIYEVDNPEAKLTVPKNKGRESMVYLTYIIDHYDNLPDNVLFVHPTRFQWHNDDPDYDGLRMLRNFQLPYLQKKGYVNMRCVWVLGCPAEIQPLESKHREDVHAGEYYRKAFELLFPGKPIPETVAASCCAQFAATREKIRERPKSDYEHYRQWIMDTDLTDAISGRVMEYSWHMIFGNEPVHCPDAKACYCNVFGLCDLDCQQDSCAGQYFLPPYSSLPHGWPMIGWKGEERNFTATDL